MTTRAPALTPKRAIIAALALFASVGIASGATAPLRGGGRAAPAHSLAERRARELARIRPRIVRRYIPLSATRKRETAAYALRHYGRRTYRLGRPRVIVEHVAVADTVGEVYNTFARDLPDPERHELPGLCAHFFVGGEGTIYQLAPLSLICRHVSGLNYTAIGIEHAGFQDSDVLYNPRELAASLRLARWLRCRYGIHLRDVIGHAENLGSPYWKERDPRLRRQLRAGVDRHGDWRRASMVEYRRRLQGLRC